MLDKKRRKSTRALLINQPDLRYDNVRKINNIKGGSHEITGKSQPACKRVITWTSCISSASNRVFVPFYSRIKFVFRFSAYWPGEVFFARQQCLFFHTFEKRLRVRTCPPAAPSCSFFRNWIHFGYCVHVATALTVYRIFVRIIIAFHILISNDFS